MSLKLTHRAVDRLIARGNPLREEEVADAARRPEAGALLTQILGIDSQDPDDDVLDRLGWTREQARGARRSSGQAAGLGAARGKSRRRIAVLRDPAPEPDAVTVPLLRRPPRYHRGLAVAAAAVVLVIAGTLAGVTLIGSTDPLHEAVTTPWRAARPISPGAGPHIKSGTWQLVDAQLSGTWQQNVHGPPPGYLACPRPRACYVMSGRYASSAANAPLLSETLYVSADAGVTWSALPMPSGFAPTSALTCPTATWCGAGGTYQGQAVLATTTNGGHSFTLQALPSGLGTLRSLSCPTTRFCGGLVSTGPSGPWTSPATAPADATFLAITDSGQAFADEPIAPGESMGALACTSSLDCVAVGTSDTTASHVGTTGVGAVTTDGGRTWKPSTFPTGFALHPDAQLACSGTGHCMVLGAVPVTVENPPQCASFPHQSPPVSAPASPPAMSPAVQAVSQLESQLATAANLKDASSNGGFSCSNGNWTTVSDVAASADGGRTWSVETLPSDVPDPILMGLACATPTQCWLAGSEQVPQAVGNAHDASSPVLLGTTDGGITWSKVTFSVPATAPNPTGQSYLDIGSVSCPSATVCVASGATAASASTAPLYRWVIPGN